jgi:hypothetical protein
MVLIPQPTVVSGSDPETGDLRLYLGPPARWER